MNIFNLYIQLNKTSLKEIVGWLDLRDLAKIWRLNKFFLCLISNSNSANLIWKRVCEENGLGLESTSSIQEFVDKLELNQFEKNLNLHCLFLKYSQQTEWDENCGKQIHFNKERTSFYTSPLFPIKKKKKI